MSIALAGFALLAIAAQSSAQKYITIDPPDPGNQSTYAWGINALGWVDGTYLDANNVWRGFVWMPNGKITTFDVKDAGTYAWQGTIPQGINIMGAITGHYIDGDVAHGFLRARDGRVTTFDVPGAGASGDSFCGLIGSWLGDCLQGTFPESINDFGEIAGYYVDSNWVTHGFIRAFNGNITRFDAPGAGTLMGQGTFVNYTASSLNDAGVLAGFYVDPANVVHGYQRSRNGKIMTFDAPGVGTGYGQGTIPSSINIEGVISSICADENSVWHGCVRTRDGRFTTYSAPGDPNLTATVGEGINDFGVATGYVFDEFNVWHGYLRTPDGTLTMFEAPGASTDPGLGTIAQNINWAGMIVGIYFDATKSHGFVRMPR